MVVKIKRRQSNKPAKALETPLSKEEIFASSTEREIKADRLVSIAQRQLKTSVDFKQNRMNDIQKSIDLGNGKTKPALKGRWNVPLPLMSGFHDTLLSKTDDEPHVKFSHTDIADMPRSKKVQAKFDQDSSDVNQMWALKDRMEKSMAIYTGVGLSKVYAYNDDDGKYCSVYDVVDYQDFECEPMGGQILKNHKFKGQRNIFKSKSELVAGATGDDPIYSKKKVLQLVATVGSDDYKRFDKVFQEKTERLKSLGFAPEMHSYMGVPTYNLVEWYMEDPDSGEKWYLLFEARSGIWIRACPLKEIFECDEDPFVAWHTHPDPFNFWSKAPADDMRPVAEGMTVVFNQALDNREKKNYGQRAYDPAVFPDPAQLEWRPDGLVEVTAGITASQAIGSGIYSFTIPDMPEQGTINLLTFMDQMTGTKTGVTNDAQGQSQEKTNGIYFGNLQQVADRLGLYNKSYSEAWGRKARLYYFGLREHVKDNKLMVSMIGIEGYNWVQLVEDDVYPTHDFNITITGGQAQAQADELTNRARFDGLKLLLPLPQFSARLNVDATIEQVLRLSKWDEASIKQFMDSQGYGASEIIAEATQAIEEILENQTPKQNRSATPLFMQTIIDFASDSEDLDLQTYSKLMQYAESHQQIALQNEMRKARAQATLMGVVPGQDTEKATPAAPVPPPIMPNGKQGVMPEPTRMPPSPMTTSAGR